MGKVEKHEFSTVQEIFSVYFPSFPLDDERRLESPEEEGDHIALDLLEDFERRLRRRQKRHRT